MMHCVIVIVSAGESGTTNNKIMSYVSENSYLVFIVDILPGDAVYKHSIALCKSYAQTKKE